ncbi:phosphatidylglycerol/phosphatidylinositol transfer protein, Npc2p [Pseudohyphozyma bogoriensis]|nr:phosphatidylglycerol/phosphatidylinositol transfer protein, Npc2p [Pseudohyphozyma bogoriensis]
MRLLSLLALLPLTLAIPAPAPALNPAVNWAAGQLSQIQLGDKDTVRTATTWDWFDCGSPDDAIAIKSIKLKPDPPVPGKDLTVYAEGKIKTLVDEGAYADVTVKLGLIKLLTKTFDICDELSNANATLQCPIQPDDYSITQTLALPEEIPPKFSVHVNAFTQLDEPMACLDILINFLAPNPSA